MALELANELWLGLEFLLEGVFGTLAVNFHAIEIIMKQEEESINIYCNIYRNGQATKLFSYFPSNPKKTPFSNPKKSIPQPSFQSIINK